MDILESMRRSQQKRGIIPSLISQHSRYAFCKGCGTVIEKARKNGIEQSYHEPHYGLWEGDEVLYFHEKCGEGE
jgi:hypothetical protein